MHRLKDLKCKFTLKGSDAEYVVLTQIFFPDAQSSKTTKLLVFKVFPDATQTGPDVAQTGPDAAYTGPDLAYMGPDAAYTGPDVAYTGL